MTIIHQGLLEQFKKVESIKLHLEEGAVNAKVDDLKEMKSYSKDKVAFSVVLQVVELSIQEQGVYTIEVESFEPMQVFIVPINRINETSYYEAVFN